MTYELIDIVTGNTIDSFDSVQQAREVLDRILEPDASRADELALVAFDERGEAVESQRASTLREFV